MLDSLRNATLDYQLPCVSLLLLVCFTTRTTWAGSWPVWRAHRSLITQKPHTGAHGQDFSTHQLHFIVKLCYSDSFNVSHKTDPMAPSGSPRKLLLTLQLSPGVELV